MTTPKRKRAKVPDARKYAALPMCAVTKAPYGASVPGYKLPSLANARLHWRAHAKLTSGQKHLGARMAFAMDVGSAARPIAFGIRLTRVGPRLLDEDNLASAFKHIRDGIAWACCVDDGPTGPITWRYEQRKGPYAIEARYEVRECLT